MKTNTVERWVTTAGALVVLTLLASLMLLAGCNTVKGLAKDVYSVTEGIQNEMVTDSANDGIRPNNWD